MKIQPLGRYTPLANALKYYANVSSHTLLTKERCNLEPNLGQSEYQILEFICLHENENKIMSEVSSSLGILQSTTTKATKRLIELGLIEKYRIVGNKKNIILKPTVEGRSVYSLYLKHVMPAFSGFIDCLAKFSDDDLAVFEQAILSLSQHWNDPENVQLSELVKVE